mgnify:CR=1 FL=1|jgi:putative endonuclease
MSGRNYQNGLAAEDAATRAYTANGATLLHSRWRSAAGEIDLIFRHGPLIIFAEVKARKSHGAAANALSPKQSARLLASAEIYLSDHCPQGQDARFDLVMVDANARIEILENCFQ